MCFDSGVRSVGKLFSPGKARARRRECISVSVADCPQRVCAVHAVVRGGPFMWLIDTITSEAAQFGFDTAVGAHGK